MYIIQLLIRHIYGAHEFYTSRTVAKLREICFKSTKETVVERNCVQTPIKLTLDYGGHSLARQ